VTARKPPALPPKLRPLAQELFVALMGSGRSLSGGPVDSRGNATAAARQSIRLAMIFDEEASR
jgi:hypothetical protein